MNLRKEIPLLIIVALPFLYLAFIYADLPDTVPTHWNGKGEIDDYGPKSTLWIIPFMITGLIYILMTIIPKIDPKGQIQRMGAKFYQLKFILILFMSAIAMYIIYAAQQADMSNPKIIFVLMGMLFAAIGNYMPSVKPNYFIGIRTPWTLESETVWKKTHRMAGKFWIIGGLAIMILAFLFSMSEFLIPFAIITAVITLVPLVYSYIWFKKEKTALE